MSWLPKRRVLVPFDFSNSATEAIKTALSLVDEAAHLDIVHVSSPPHPADPAALWGKEAERIKRTQALLREHLVKHELDDVAVHVRNGDPGHEIVALADELAIELIVMPSHGRHGVKRVLLGSVAERVLRFANCPVLVLRRGKE